MILFISEICRLILGFLEDENFLKTYQTFLNECKYLEECKYYLSKGIDFPKTIHGKNLKDHLNSNENKIYSTKCTQTEFSQNQTTIESSTQTNSIQKTSINNSVQSNIVTSPVKVDISMEPNIPTNDSKSIKKRKSSLANKRKSLISFGPIKQEQENLITMSTDVKESAQTCSDENSNDSLFDIDFFIKNLCENDFAQRLAESINELNMKKLTNTNCSNTSVDTLMSANNSFSSLSPTKLNTSSDTNLKSTKPSEQHNEMPNTQIGSINLTNSIDNNTTIVDVHTAETSKQLTSPNIVTTTNLQQESPNQQTPAILSEFDSNKALNLEELNVNIEKPDEPICLSQQINFQETIFSNINENDTNSNKFQIGTDEISLLADYFSEPAFETLFGALNSSRDNEELNERKENPNNESYLIENDEDLNRNTTQPIKVSAVMSKPIDSMPKDTSDLNQELVRPEITEKVSFQFDDTLIGSSNKDEQNKQNENTILLDDKSSIETSESNLHMVNTNDMKLITSTDQHPFYSMSKSKKSLIIIAKTLTEVEQIEKQIKQSNLEPPPPPLGQLEENYSNESSNDNNQIKTTETIGISLTNEPSQINATNSCEQFVQDKPAQCTNEQSNDAETKQNSQLLLEADTTTLVDSIVNTRLYNVNGEMDTTSSSNREQDVCQSIFDLNKILSSNLDFELNGSVQINSDISSIPISLYENVLKRDDETMKQQIVYICNETSQSLDLSKDDRLIDSEMKLLLNNEIESQTANLKDFSFTETSSSSSMPLPPSTPLMRTNTNEMPNAKNFEESTNLNEKQNIERVYFNLSSSSSSSSTSSPAPPPTPPSRIPEFKNSNKQNENNEETNAKTSTPFKDSRIFTESDEIISGFQAFESNNQHDAINSKGFESRDLVSNQAGLVTNTSTTTSTKETHEIVDTNSSTKSSTHKQQNQIKQSPKKNRRKTIRQLLGSTTTTNSSSATTTKSTGIDKSPSRILTYNDNENLFNPISHSLKTLRTTYHLTSKEKHINRLGVVEVEPRDVGFSKSNKLTNKNMASTSFRTTKKILNNNSNYKQTTTTTTTNNNNDDDDDDGDLSQSISSMSTTTSSNPSSLLKYESNIKSKTNKQSNSYETRNNATTTTTTTTTGTDTSNTGGTITNNKRKRDSLDEFFCKIINNEKDQKIDSRDENDEDEDEDHERSFNKQLHHHHRPRRHSHNYNQNLDSTSNSTNPNTYRNVNRQLDTPSNYEST